MLLKLLATAIDEIRTFLVAGHETSATGIAWTIATLPKHPGVMTTLAPEFDASRNAQRLSDVEQLETTARVDELRVHEYTHVLVPVGAAVARGDVASRVPREILVAG